MAANHQGTSVPKSEKTEKSATKSSRKRNGETARQIAEAIKAGASNVKEIATKIGISVAAVKRQLKLMQDPQKCILLGISEDINAIMKQNKQKNEADERNKVLELASFLSDNEIAVRLGIKKSRVTLIRRKFNIRSKYKIVTANLLGKLPDFPARVTEYGNLNTGLVNPYADYSTQRKVRLGILPKSVLLPYKRRTIDEDKINQEIADIMTHEWTTGSFRSKRGRSGRKMTAQQRAIAAQGLH